MPLMSMHADAPAPELPPRKTAEPCLSQPVAGPGADDLQQELVVLGLARNCESTLQASVDQLAAVLPPFKTVRWCVVESDSSDGTVAELRQLAARMPGFSFQTLGTLAPKMPLRTQRIAHCRNASLDWLQTHAPQAGYVLVADLDGVTSRLTAEALRSCWFRQDWAVCTANAEGPYYDVWALRHPDWCPGDCWREYRHLVRHGLHPERAKSAAVYARMLTIDPGADWIEVDSAFGGLALYRGAALLKGARYEGLAADGTEQCEHVSVHAAIRAQGGRLFINPALVAAGGSDTDGYWPGRQQALKATDGLLFRGLLKLFYGSRASKDIRRLIKGLG